MPPLDPTPWSPWLRCALGVVHRRAGVDGLSHLCHRPLPATASGAVKWRTRLAKNEVHATVLREGSPTPAGSLRGLWGGRGSENAEVGVAASVRIDRRIRHDQRRPGR